jgi:Putative transposase/Transposase zinc-binding domain
MPRPACEIADIFRRYGEAFQAQYGQLLGPLHLLVLKALSVCRTAQLGGHVLECDACGHQKQAYNSCHNRHCPKCQSSLRAQWFEDRQRDLLPVEYFHVVFTLSDELGPLALQNKVVIYNLLFRAASKTLLDAAAGWKDLKAQIGFFAILHTWGQKLDLHPHLHCVVPGGGISLDGTRWVSCPRGFFMPVKLLSRKFRGTFLAFLKEAHRRGELTLAGRLQSLQSDRAFRSWLGPLYDKEWVVYAKPPWKSPEHVLKYLARYTHRVAIGNSRLQSIDDGQVTFTYKDYRHQSRQRTLTLAATEFIRRFMMHVLPSGFVRIRYYGFLANARRKDQLHKIRSLLGAPQSTIPAEESDAPPQDGVEPLPDQRCPHCQQGLMRTVEIVPRPRLSEILYLPLLVPT